MKPTYSETADKLLKEMDLSNNPGILLYGVACLIGLLIHLIEEKGETSG